MNKPNPLNSIAILSNCLKQIHQTHSQVESLALRVLYSVEKESCELQKIKTLGFHAVYPVDWLQLALVQKTD